jgi:phosphohistidine swiveling domain-containing protein
MKLEKVLEKLEELLRGWGLTYKDWILVGCYANKLLGYKTKLRKGHFNVKINKDKIWWKTIGVEAFPPKDSKEFRQFKKWMKETGFDSDLIPESSEKLKKKSKEDFKIYPLPNKKKIRVATPVGALKDLDFVLSQCTEKGLGIEKGRYLLNVVKDIKRACQKKGDLKAIKIADKLIEKYSFLEKEEKFLKDYSKIKILKGNCAFKGKVKGKVRVIINEPEIKKLKRDEILITKMTSAKFTPFINRAKAIVTDDGGLLCHAAVISREFGIPCIIGTKIATKVLKDGDLVEVDAGKGVVKILKK